MAIITLSRQVAAHGDEVAQELARKLNYKFITRKDIEKRIIDLGFPESKMAKYDERKPGFFASLTKDRDEYLNYVQYAILEAAEQKNVIIIGRGAFAVLQNVPNNISVRLIADQKTRIERLEEEFNWTEKQAIQRITESDTNRKGFHKSFFNAEIDDPSHFLMVLNTGVLDVDMASNAIAAMDKAMITPEKEEIAAGQESITTPNVVSFIALNKSAYFYSKDSKGMPYYFYYIRSDSNQQPYRFINEYIAHTPLWATIKTKFASIELGITLQNRDNDVIVQWPMARDASTQISDLLYKTVVSLKDSGNSIIKSMNISDQISEWHYKQDNAFVIVGAAEVPHDTIYSFYIFLIIPVLIIYTILLLLVVTGFISIFIKEPMSIYKEAITNLEKNEYGTTIKSFSSDEFNSITIAFNEMSEALRQKEQIKRYVSDKLVKSVENNALEQAGTGKIEKVTILSSDIRNFTGISEAHTPAEIVEMLNSYFTQMQLAISEQGGIIDKYIGDAIQAVFYDEQGKEPQSLRACRAALNMRKALSNLNLKRIAAGLFTIDNGIGIDTDFAITGSIGSTQGRKDFSVNGKVVERAASIEAKTKATVSKILISKYSEKEISDLLITKSFDEETLELLDVKY